MNSVDYAVYSIKDIQKMMMKNCFKIKEAQKLSKVIFTVAGQKSGRLRRVF